MMPIKIECGCGQRYAFDIEPVEGRMPSPVACPACGADGTAAANDQIDRQLADQPAVKATPKPITLRVVSPQSAPPSSTPQTVTPSPRRSPLPGQVSHEQAATEARAKAMWGDSPEQVTQYLWMQGFDRDEASNLVKAVFRERAAEVRANGIRKIFTGVGLMCVPIIALVIFLCIGVILLKIFAVTVMIGLWGVWQVINGILMAVAPKADKGDVGAE